MKRIFTLIFSIALATPLWSDSAADPVLVVKPIDQWRADPKVQLDAIDIDLNDFIWLARPVVVFADSPNDPRLREQIELLAARSDVLAERDVVVLIDSNPDANSDIRRKLRPRGFMLVLIGKDGGVKLRKPFPWDVRELSRVIDKMPLRQQEIRDKRNAGR
ncbi:DUF4174 domain-containing protein [Parasulfitobacter algicola]|uniref:DUF4174 domain-containing protein n=1 Tax=Parasulfitobacter algicola TaxID=2614809 RepID=A0ABX2IUF8_9RHOB|nr:DUF4174 domain-containing protein [Sulfitobacter algicola]NSX56521.1 DUF4174 domain-containing protein [Sulfitobacter algicola]